MLYELLLLPCLVFTPPGMKEIEQDAAVPAYFMQTDHPVVIT